LQHLSRSARLLEWISDFAFFNAFPPFFMFQRFFGQII
jgi:hypothetical protein